MNLSAERAVYDALRAVFSDGAFSAQILNRVLKNAGYAEKPYITKLFYGTLDKSVQFDYIIGKVAAKKPQSAVVALLKLGLYLLRYTDTPAYAAVHKTVELAKQAGKKGAEGFINAALKKSQEIVLPAPDTVPGLSVAASVPEWIVRRLAGDYGFAFAHDFLLFELPTQTHIRINKTRIGVPEFEQKYPEIIDNRSKYGYYVTHKTLDKLKKEEYLVQSFSSMCAVQKYIDGISPKTVLDLCAAPGGKSVYLKELLPASFVTACDVHAHRAELIRKYAASAGAEISVLQNDAAVYLPDFSERFDLVVCDVPCSGIGVAGKKPEILWNRKEGDIDKLCALQLKILETASKYVKSGGRLSYSTCTVFKAENEEVVGQFLKANPLFQKDGAYLNLFPHTDGCDGFFVANFTKK